MPNPLQKTPIPTRIGVFSYPFSIPILTPKKFRNLGIRMLLQRLNIINYRNIAAADLELSPGINCLVGPNGAGKTNILDSIYYLSFCKSYFGLPDSVNIRHDEPFFVISGHYAGEGGETDIYCGVKRGVKKQFKRDKKEYQRIADHIGLLPLVIISPSDEELIADGAEARRRYADSVISQCDKAYMDHLMAYNRLITQRNILLKQMAEAVAPDMRLLDVYDQQLAVHGQVISMRRRQFVEWLQPVAASCYCAIADDAEQVEMNYITGLDRYDLYQGLVDSRVRDIALGYTSRGIHKDEIEILMDGFPIRRVGSQGQRKSFVIALKIAQYKYLAQQKGQLPTLLLDDIFDKLDTRRGDNLIAMMTREGFGQIFISDTNIDRLRRVLDKTEADHAIFNINGGAVDSTSIAEP